MQNDTKNLATGHIFFFGLGYSAALLAEQLKQEGWRISGTTRSAAKMKTLEQKGYGMWYYDATQPLPDGALNGVTHILHSIPPSEDGDAVFMLESKRLESLTGLEWMGYFSTTGVYGDKGGAWVDESSSLTPSNPRQLWRVQAEKQWLGMQRKTGMPIMIFRLAGIYGEGRSPLTSLQEGKARRINRPEQYFSRIHVEDITRVLLASFACIQPGEIYNVCDNMPAPQADVVTFGAELLSMEPPPLQTLEEADLSPMARSFYQSSRRVNNGKLARELGVELQYPDYKAGLIALHAAQGNS